MSGKKLVDEKMVRAKWDMEEIEIPSFGEIFQNLCKNTQIVHDIHISGSVHIKFEDPVTFWAYLFTDHRPKIGFRCLIGDPRNKHAWVFAFRDDDWSLWISLFWKFDKPEVSRD